MRNRRRERGEGQLGCVIGLILLAAAIFVAYKIIPVKVAAADFRREVIDEARSAGRHNDARIRASIMNKAEELELPVKQENLKVVRRNNSIKIEVEYTVPIDLLGYIYENKFHHVAENPIF